MKNRFLFLLTFISVASSFAQSGDIKHDFLKRNDFSLGGGLHTNGWNIWTERGYIKDAYKRKFYQIEYTQLHDPKEMKQTLDAGFSIKNNPAKPFVYGKQNSLLLLNAYVGKQNLLGHKSDKSGVEITVKYGAGISLGIVKPYYLVLVYQRDPDKFKNESYTAANADHFLDWNLIYGGGGFWKGFDHVSFLPGAAAKASLNFDWAVFDDYIKSIEVGAMLQVFYKPVPIMLLSSNKNYFPNLFVNIKLGKRW